MFSRKPGHMLLYGVQHGNVSVALYECSRKRSFKKL